MTNIQNHEEAAKTIKDIAERIENLKIIYYNYENNSNISILNHEKELAYKKYNIISFLSNNYNYQSWKNANNNNGLFLIKYINKDFFVNELKFEYELAGKLKADFNDIYEHTNKELLLTNREKQTIQEYNNSNISESDRYFYSNEEELAKKVYDKALVFDKNLKFMFEYLPEESKLSPLLKKCLSHIKNNQILLALSNIWTYLILLEHFSSSYGCGTCNCMK